MATDTPLIAEGPNCPSRPRWLPQELVSVRKVDEQNAMQDINMNKKDMKSTKSTTSAKSKNKKVKRKTSADPVNNKYEER